MAIHRYDHSDRVCQLAETVLEAMNVQHPCMNRITEHNKILTVILT